nr:diacylglycerol O-acyltransferase 1 [Ciona intestinalis]|eukprot:XP_026694537.1 diacylglycerol O-acyltransferase 1 [Ciona intestinalis]
MSKNDGGSTLRQRKSNRSISTSGESFEEPIFGNGNSKSETKHEKLKVIPTYGTKICHNARPSLFSTSSGFDDYRGFLNLCVVLLVISNARVFLENIRNYGILVDPLQWLTAVLHNPYQWPNLLLVLGSSVFIFLAFHIERHLAKNHISARTGIYLHSINLLVVILLPPFQILQLDANPVGSLFSCSFYVVLFLKLWSYAQTNKWYRDAYIKALSKRRIHRTMSMPSSQLRNLRDNSTVLVQYPYNLSYRNLIYFIAAPTLCYEANYPRNESINKSYLARRVVEILFLSQLQLALIQQWVVPVLQKSILPIHNFEGYYVVERLLKLSVPNHFIWLVFFYVFFHSVLNALAEVLKFADREFYRDWWNADTIGYFWQAWNIPVHKWCVRHVYKPLLSIGVSKLMAQISVFMLSAFFHEYLVSIPLHMFKFWAFFGMTMQIPLTFFTVWVSKRFSSNYGNMIVWMSLILGQPVAILAYVYHYYVTSYTNVS